jgi:hypothetical protein
VACLEVLQSKGTYAYANCGSTDGFAAADVIELVEEASPAYTLASVSASPLITRTVCDSFELKSWALSLA